MLVQELFQAVKTKAVFEIFAQCGKQTTRKKEEQGKFSIALSLGENVYFKPPISSLKKIQPAILAFA